MADQSIRIALALPAQTPACLALLPEVGELAPLEFLTATVADKLVGAAVIVWREQSAPDGFAIWLRTMPGHERRGIGRALLNAVQDLTGGETDGLRTVIGLDPGSAGAQLAMTSGYTPFGEELTYAIEIASLHDSMQRIGRNLSRPGKLPPDTRVIALADAPLDAVAALIAAALPGAPGGAVARLRDTEANGVARYRAQHSSVVMEGDRVIGALLVRRTGDRWFVEANVAAPDRRGGHVNALQLARTVQAAVDEGLAEVEFQTSIANHHTMRVTDFGRSRVVARQTRYYQAATSA